MSRVRRRESGLESRIPQAPIPDSLNWLPRAQGSRPEAYFPKAEASLQRARLKSLNPILPRVTQGLQIGGTTITKY
jgi:hypothetical protein